MAERGWCRFGAQKTTAEYPSHLEGSGRGEAGAAPLTAELQPRHTAAAYTACLPHIPCHHTTSTPPAGYAWSGLPATKIYKRTSSQCEQLTNIILYRVSIDTNKCKTFEYKVCQLCCFLEEEVDYIMYYVRLNSPKITVYCALCDETSTHVLQFGY